MKIFKTIVVTLLLLGLATGALFFIKGSISGPTEGEVEEHQDEPLEDIYSQQLKQYDGTLKVLGISIYQEGTHRLEKDDALVLILESKKIDLSQFEGKEVKVRGFVRDTVEGGQKIMDVSTVELVKESGVKLFNEVGYEFSFSYPADWEIKKESGKVTFLAKKSDIESQPVMAVYQYEDVEGTLEAWLKDRDQNLFYEEAQVKVGSTTGTRRTVKNGDEQIIKTYVKEGNNAYELRLLAQDEVSRNQYFSIVEFFTATSVEPEKVDEGTPEETEKAPATEPDAEATEEATPEEGGAAEAPATEGATETTPAPTENETSSSQSFSDLEPLTAAEIQAAYDKGFSPFTGRMLSFEYPRMWYFSYLGDSKYGFTDDKTYQSNNQEIRQENSRILLIIGAAKDSCSISESVTLESTSYTVCAREPGLESITKKIASSIRNPQ